MDLLLLRLRDSPSDQQAWDHFVEQARPVIFAYCRKWRLQEADAEDVTQTVLVRLARVLRTFVQDPARSFGGWLRVVTQNAVKDFLADLPFDLPNGDVEPFLMKIEARVDRTVVLDTNFDRQLFAAACARVRVRLAPNTWKAFELIALEGLSGEIVAAQLSMSVMAVFKAKSRVQKMLRLEVSESEPIL